MTEERVRDYWNDNAPAWTQLARSGYDLYRDAINTPAFFALLPEVCGLQGIDIGCGEGHNTRLLAARGANMDAIDISPVFIHLAQATEQANGPLIQYQVASATKLPFADDAFDFATSFMCLMDVPDAKAAIKEVFRVIRPGGFFLFSIEHPCFKTKHLAKVKDAHGQIIAYEVGEYFSDAVQVEKWLFKKADQAFLPVSRPFQIPVFHRTLSFWINETIGAGFRLDAINEPHPNAQTLHDYPELAGAGQVAYFLHLLCRK